LALACLTLITLAGCSTPPEKTLPPPVAPAAQSPAPNDAERLDTLKARAHQLPILARLAIAAKANTAVSGPDPGADRIASSGCQSVDERLAQLQALEDSDPAELLRRLGKQGRSRAAQADEVAMTRKALGIVRDEAYIGDSVDFITAVTRQVVEYPSQVEANLNRLLLSGSPSKELRKRLAALHGAVKSDIAGARRCGYDINRYIKRLIPTLPEQRCEHRMGNQLMTQLRGLPEAELAASVAQSAVDNPTLATAIQIYAYSQWGVTVTDDDLRALSAALDRDPDLNPLVNAGIDALVRGYHLDKVVEGVEKARSGCARSELHR
jgi:hypothetical protein